MVPNLIKHVRTSIEYKLSDFLNSSYIINVVLGDMEDTTRSSFIDKYVSTYDDKGKRLTEGAQIKVLTNYPDDIANYSSPFILVGMGDGKETGSSIGTNTGSYEFKTNSDYRHEEAPLRRVDNTTIGLKLKGTPAIATVTIPNLTFPKNNLTFHDGELQIGNLSPSLLDGIDYGTQTLGVNYENLVDNENWGTSYGYMLTETVSMVIVSKNLDEIRAIDSIIKAMFIIMRQEDEELSYYHLGKLSFNPPQPLDDTAPNLGNMTFGREIVAEYQVDYTMDSRSLQKIKNIIVNRP